MTKNTVAAVALSLAAAATVGGCGSNTASTSTTVSSAAPAASAGASTTAMSTPMAGMSGMSGTPMAGMSSTPATSASAAAPSGSAKLLGIAMKLGCIKPEFTAANAKGRANGTLAMVTCTAGSRKAVLLQALSASDRDRLVKSLGKEVGTKSPYLRGDDWFALVSSADGKSMPTKAELASFAEKTGATVAVVS